MYKWILAFYLLLFTSTSFAKLDISLACKEKKEQQQSILTKLSTSITEAHLAGQCTGYDSYTKINVKESCTEFIEQKRSLFSFSTSIKEAYSAGTCIGAIYKVAKRCGIDTDYINYFFVADGASSLSFVARKLGCDGYKYGG